MNDWGALKLELQERIYKAILNKDSDIKSIVLKFEEDYDLQDVSWYPEGTNESEGDVI